MKNIILSAIAALSVFFCYGQSPNGITPATGGGTEVSAFTNPASQQVDSLTITLSDGTKYKVPVPKDAVRSNAHPVNPAISSTWIDTLGADTIYVNNAGIWERMQPPVVDGAMLFYTLNATPTQFYPNNSPPVGAVIYNTYLGCWTRKYSNGIFPFTLPSGNGVREQERWFKFTNLNDWDLDKYAAATLSFQLGVDGVVGTPLNLSTQQRGSERVIVLVNGTGSPRSVTFSSFYRENSGLSPLSAISVPENSELTLVFRIDANDSDVIMRMVSYSTSAPIPTNLTVTGSSPTYNINSSTGTGFTISQGNNVTITRTGNDLSIAASGGGGGGATDLSFTGSGPYTLNSSTGNDVTFTQGAGVNLTRSGNDLTIAANPASVTGVNDQNNGIDISLSSGLVGVNYDFDELPDDPTYNGTEVFIFKDLIDGQYKKATTSFLSGGYVDLSNNQSIAGTKSFTTGLKFGSPALPTGSLFGASTPTIFSLKGPTTMTESNFQSFGGYTVHVATDGVNNLTTYITSTGDITAPAKSGSIVLQVSNGSAPFLDAVKILPSGRMMTLLGSGVDGGSGGDFIVGNGGLGMEGGSTHYVWKATSVSGQELVLLEAGSTKCYTGVGSSQWTFPSDIRLKQNVRTLSVLDKISLLRGVSYELKSDSIRQIGVIAQEIQSAFPEGVRTDENGYLGVGAMTVAAIALQGVKELNDENKRLEAEIDYLKYEMCRLKALVSEHNRTKKRWRIFGGRH